MDSQHKVIDQIRRLENFAAELPADLAATDERLQLYGRWAMDRWAPRRCGSAERDYLPTRGEALQARREPRELLMPMADAVRCQRALARVPDKERIVLTILYVPRRIPAQALLRKADIPPRISRERHLAGVRMFDNLYRVLGVECR